jgi:hypothetical protein
VAWQPHLQLCTDIFEWGVLERFDVARAQREVGRDYSGDEPADRVVCLDDVATCAGADRGGDEAERLGDQLCLRGEEVSVEGNKSTCLVVREAELLAPAEEFPHCLDETATERERTSISGYSSAYI